MRAIELAKVAAAAEALRTKRYARRQGIRLIYAGAAALFLLALFAMAHVLAIVLLALAMPSWAAVLIVMLGDLAVGGVLATIALRSQPDQIEREAAALRRTSLAEARKSATSLATIGEVAGLTVGLVGRRGARSTRLGKAWMIADLASRFIRR